MIYFLNILLIIAFAVIAFKGVRLFNKKFEQNILNDIHRHFQSKGYIVKSIKSIANNAKEIPFNVDEWSPSTGIYGKNYYANRFWKVVLVDSEQTEIISWVNTGHLFLYKMYLIEKMNEKANA